MEFAQEPVLVVEAGGTHLRAALFDPASAMLSHRRKRLVESYLETAGAVDELERRLADAIRESGEDALDGAVPRGRVVVAYPGPVDEAGRVLASPTVVGATSACPFPLGSILASHWPDAQIFVMNEMTASGYRYLTEGTTDFCILTVGSGIGHKIFLDGRPQLGRNSRGGEVGHLLVDLRPDAPICDCGARGHIGGIASGRGIVRLARRLAEIDGNGFHASRLASHDSFLAGGAEQASAALVAAVKGGDDWATEVVREATRYLGIGIASLHLAVGVERVILIGGFARALGETYREIVAQAAARACWALGQDWDEIVRLGEDDDDHGMIGAGLFATRYADRGR